MYTTSGFVRTLARASPLTGLLGRCKEEDLAGHGPRLSEQDGIWLLLETLALRDPSVLRHAAAVARDADALADATGLPDGERSIVFAAGLMHDIGKQALPDHILSRRGELQPD